MFIKDKKFYTHIFTLMLPLILQQLLRISVDTVNSIMLGSIDQVQMSAVAQANQIFFIYYTICSGLSVGACVLVSQYWGKGDRKSISVITAHALRVITAVGLAVTLAVALFPAFFMRIYSSDPDIVRIGAGYLRLVSFMYIPCGISVMLFGIGRGVEQVKIILHTNILSYSVNILIDWLLIYGMFGLPKLGVTGVAIGTIAARFVELLVCGYIFFSNPDIPFRPEDIRKSDPELRTAFFRISLPIIAHEIIWSLGTSSGAMITGQLGKMAVAGYNVTTVLYDLFASIGHGLMHACSVVIGMTLGTGDTERAKKEANSMLVLGVITGVIVGLLTFVIKDVFLRLYALEPDSVRYARQFMNVIACIWPFSLIEMITIVAILRAGGQGKVGFYADIVIMWMICIPLAWFAAFRLHAEPWVVVAIIKSIIVLESIVGVIAVYRYKWLKNLTTGAK